MIVPEKKIAFIHIPKCGGSSVETLFLNEFGYLEGRDNGQWGRLTEDQRKSLMIGGNSWQHHTAKMLEDKIGEDWKVFTIVRDPIQRAYSEFFYQRRVKDLGSLHKGLKPYVECDLSKAIELGYFWDKAYAFHGASQSRFVSDTKHDVEVLRLEDIDKTFPEFTRKTLGKALRLPVLNVSERPETKPLTTAAFNLLMDRWGGDYDTFGYEKPKGLEDRIPRTIWMFWNKGLKKAPRVVKAAVKSWKVSNVGWDVRVLDDSSPEVLEAKHLWEGKNLKQCHKADLLRLHLLNKFGGVWADATVLCLKPLSLWLDEAATSDGFFIFRNGPVANWFIASKPEGKNISEWLHRAKEYWVGRDKPHTYTWPHKLAGAMLREGLFHDMEYIDASDKHSVGPHLFCKYKADANGVAGAHFFPRILSESPHMLKMTWKTPIAEGSKFDWLIKSFE